MPLDARVEENIVDLVVHEGITDTQTMDGHLRDYVRTQLFTRQTAPPSPNKRYFPEDKTIYNKIYATIAIVGCSRYNFISSCHTTKLYHSAFFMLF